MDIYREQILDHYKHPRNFGSLEKPDVKMEEGNVACGDRIVMEISLEASKPRSLEAIKDIRFSGVGCAISQASESMLTEKVKYMALEDVMKLTPKDVMDMLGTELTPSRIKCALLSLDVLQKAVLSLQNKK